MFLVTRDSGFRSSGDGSDAVHSVNLYERGVADHFVRVSRPDWREVIARGEDATNYYQRETVKWFPVVGTHWWTYPPTNHFEQVWTTDKNTTWTVPTVTQELINEAMAQADKRWMSKISDLRSSVMLGVSAGELRETVRMISNPFGTLADLTTKYLVKAKGIRQGYLSRRTKMKNKYLSRRAKRERVAVLDALNDSYLEFTYGLNPLLNDVRNVFDELGRSRSVSTTTDVRASGYADATHNVPGFNWDPIRPNQIYLNFDVRYLERASVKKFGRVVSQPQTWQQRFGFDARSFIPTLWELLPKSFMLDYITNIGDVISALCYQTPDTVYSYTNVRVVLSGETYFSGFSFSDSVDDESRQRAKAIFPPYMFERVYFERSPGTLAAPAAFHLEVPSARQALNSASIALSIFNSRR